MTNPFQCTDDEALAAYKVSLERSLYKISVEHDGGISTISVQAPTKEEAIQRVMHLEMCPRSAIINVS